MKLLNKTSIYYLLFALPVFMVCSGLLYYFISTEIISNLDGSLLEAKIKLEQKFKAGKNIAELDDEMILKSVDNSTPNIKDNFSDTTMYDSLEAEMLPFRALSAVVSDGKNKYQFTILKSYIETDDLIESILFPVIILFVFLLMGFFLINFWISKKLWNPFYKTLDRLTNYKINETPVTFDIVAIREFSELNKTLTSMTEKIHSDFISQKQFIENASHEIQTPLAVIKTKIELLIQSKTISETDMQIIQSVYNASNKLSSLNKALLLLSKIENHQFKDVEEVDFKILIEKTLEHFEDLISLKNVRIEKNYPAQLAHKMNPVLAEVLITNLIQNAIRHNSKDGTISIQLTENNCVISNTSNTHIANTNELFHRFKKNEASAESVGLGLAIVKEICDNYLIGIEYTCEKPIHTIQLIFNS